MPILENNIFDLRRLIPEYVFLSKVLFQLNSWEKFMNAGYQRQSG